MSNAPKVHRVREAYQGERWFRIEILEKVPGSSFPKAQKFEGNTQSAKAFLKSLEAQL